MTSNGKIARVQEDRHHPNFKRRPTPTSTGEVILPPPFVIERRKQKDKKKRASLGKETT